MNYYKAEFYLDKEAISKKDLRRELRVTSNKGFRGSTLTVDCFKYEEPYWIVPRPWAAANGFTGADETPDIKAVWEPINMSYWHNQEECITKVINKLKDVGCCRLVAETGWGKSVGALDIARQLETKVLVVVPTNEILSQFKTTAEDIFNVKPGIIKGKKEDTDQLVTLVTYQTLTRRLASNPEYTDKFGLLCVDEAHLAGCASIQAVLSSINSKYRLSVSADFYRADGLAKVYELCLGEVAAVGIKDKDQSLEKKLYIHDLPQYVDPDRCIDRFGEFSYVKYLNRLAESDEYNEDISILAKDLIKEGDRRVLIAVRRMIQVEKLYDILGSDISAVFSGKTKKKDLPIAAQAKIIIYSKSDLGFDPSKFLGKEIEQSLAPLNTVIVAYPNKNTKQIGGRGGRENRGVTPLVVLCRTNDWYHKGAVKKDVKKNWQNIEQVTDWRKA